MWKVVKGSSVAFASDDRQSFCKTYMGLSWYA